MPKLIAETDPSLFEPIEVEIEGAVYAARRFDGFAYKEFVEFDSRLRAGDLMAAYERLAYLLPDCQPDVINRLALSEVARITNWILETTTKPTRAEKNAPKPEGPLPS